MEILSNQIHNQDCNLVMDNMPDQSVQLIIADPPFGIDFNKDSKFYNRKKENVIDGYAEVLPINYYAFSYNWIERAKRILKDDGSMYIISGHSNLHHILRSINEHGLHLVNHIVWKYNFGVYTKKKFVTSHYHILFVAKNPGQIKFNTHCRFGETGDSYHDREDVWEIKREFWKNCQKNSTNLPKELVKKMIEYSSDVGDLIFDPFTGSGQVPFVAKELGRNFIACEIMPDVYEFAKKRLDTGEYLIHK